MQNTLHVDMHHIELSLCDCNFFFAHITFSIDFETTFDVPLNALAVPKLNQFVCHFEAYYFDPVFHQVIVECDIFCL